MGWVGDVRGGGWLVLDFLEGVSMVAGGGWGLGVGDGLFLLLLLAGLGILVVGMGGKEDFIDGGEDE